MSRSKSPRTNQPAYVMPAPHEDLMEIGGGLDRLRQPLQEYGELVGGRSIFQLVSPHLGRPWTWLDPYWLEYLCEQDAAVQATLKKAERSGYNQASLDRVAKAVISVVENWCITTILDHADQTAPMISQYLAAKQAYRQRHPDEEES